MLGRFWKNAEFTAFGEDFYGFTPIEVFYHFKNRSPLYMHATIFEYFSHLIAASGTPEMKPGEAAEVYAERAFQSLINQGIVTFKGSDEIH